MRVAATVHAPCVLVLLSTQADFSTGVNNILAGIFFFFFFCLKQYVSSSSSTKRICAKNLSCKEIHNNEVTVLYQLRLLNS